MVHSSLKVVKVFLASPSDLKAERIAAKEVVDEINNLSADHSGYHVDLVGWEDTVSVYGRPQATINRDLEQCEYFIGVMWKRWGTPPDDSGHYSSGFEEEFQNSIDRRQETGSPEISLLFKRIDEDQLSDPGDELKKVLKFQKKMIDDKAVLYETFDEPKEFERKIRRCITRYVQKLIEAEKGEEQDDESRARTSDSKELNGESERAATSERVTPFSVEGTKFLQHLISKTEGDEGQTSIATVDVARFRLLASIIKNSGNDKRPLGAHDANILFVNRSDLDLSFLEKVGLIDSGLEYYSSENLPLWHWLAEINAFRKNWLPLRSIFGDTEQQVGALAAMRLVSVPLLSQPLFDRENYTKIWFSEDAPNALRVAALGYLADYGMSADLSAIKAVLESGDYQTTSAAVDAVLRINLRDSREKAIRVLFELQSKSIDSNLLGSLFENGASISTELLSQGVGHGSSEVRRMVVKFLRERGALEAETAAQLISDSDAETRFEALQSLMEGGSHFSDDEAKKILVRPTVTPALGFFGGLGATDTEGESVWNQFREQRLSAMTHRELEQVASNSAKLDLDAEFVLDERQFATRGAKLRAAVDDHFKAKCAQIFEDIEQITGIESELVEKTRSIEEILRKNFTRKGLDIICRKKDTQDLNRVRKILDSGFLDYSDADIEYLKKIGEWEDIPRITASLKQPDGLRGSLLAIPTDNSKYRYAARAIYALGHNRLDELLELPAPSRLLSYLIVESTNKRFCALNDGSISRLFSSEHNDVRKAAALKCVRALPKSRLKKCLNDYVSGESYRYYNVIHWLDFGVSIPQDRARSAAATVFARGWQT